MENFWSFLDLRTIFFTMVITNLVCTMVMLLLWKLNYKRLDGISYWVVNFVLQTMTVVFILLRGEIPDWISINFANSISIVGIYLGYIGLEKFFHLKSQKRYHLIVLLSFPILFSWMTVFYPDIAVRNLIIGLYSFYFCFLGVWLVFVRINRTVRRTSMLVGIAFLLLCMVDFVRLLDFILTKHSIQNYFDSAYFESFVILSYEISQIVLTFGLALLFNRTLLSKIELQEEKYSKAFQTSPNAIILTRLKDNCILEINDTFQRMTGFDQEDVVGYTTLKLCFWENSNDRSGVLKELADGNEVRGREFNFLKKNGDRFTGLYTAQIIMIDDEKCLLSSINNISIRKKAEEELKASEEKFRSLFSSMSEGFALHEVIFDAHRNPVDYMILEVNQAFEKMVGIELKKAKGYLATVVYGVPTAPYLEIYAEVAATGKPQSFRSFFSPFNKYYDILVYSPYKDFFATVFSDITEQQKAEESLMNNEARLIHLNATKDKFFSIIAHDLKSPFNSILGFSKLLVESVRSNDYAHVEQYATIIEKSTQRTMELLMNLLEWSRSQTGKMEYLPEYLEINSIVNEVLELFEQSALQKNITIYKEPFPFTTLWADKILLSTILRNLISNAIKFTHTGGEIHLSGKVEQDMIEICMRDNGVGIKKEDLKKLFLIEENFTSKGTLNEQGTGLGLILCKEFVEKQGGKIRVESIYGQGSTFYITLPSNL